MSILKDKAGINAYNITFTNALDSVMRNKLVSRVKGKRFESGMALLSLGIMAACGSSSSGGGASGTPGVVQAGTPGNPVNFARENLSGSEDFIISAGAVTADYIVTGGDGANTITTGAGNDIIWAKGGADTISTSDGDDIIVLIGSNGESFNYTTSDLIIQEGHFKGTNLGSYLSITANDLNTAAGATSEFEAGETIDAGDGNDYVIIFGEVDLSGLSKANLDTFEVVEVHSQLTITEAQLQSARFFGADDTSTLIITTSGNVDLSVAEFGGTLQIIAGDGTAPATFMLSEETLEFAGEQGAKITLGSESQVASIDVGTIDLGSLRALAEIIENSYATLEKDANTGEVEVSVMTMVDGVATSATITAKSATDVSIMVGNDAVDLAQSSNGGVEGDFLIGTRMDDTINGGAGDDHIRGNAGNDTLNGGDGDDNLGGGSGRDVFIASKGSDTIVDFNVAHDVISFEELGISDLASLTIAGSGTELTITHADGTITLQNLDAADVTAATADPATYFADGGAGDNLIALQGEGIAPYFTVTSGSINEDGSGSFSIRASDPDGGSLTYKLLTEGSDFAVSDSGVVTADPNRLNDVRGNSQTLGEAVLLFNIDAPGDALSPTPVPVLEYTIMVEVSDGTNTVMETVTIGINNSNEAPTSVSLSGVVLPGAQSQTQPIVGTAEVTDPDFNDRADGRHTFSLGGEDAGLFSIDRDTGVVTYTGTADQAVAGADPFNIQITARDAGGLSTTNENVRVIVGGVTVNGEYTIPGSTTITEAASSASQEIGVLDVADGVFAAGASISYSVMATQNGADVSAFFDVSSGTLNVNSGQDIDYEAGSSIVITVTATDGSVSIPQPFTISLMDTNDEAPAFATPTAEFSVAEGEMAVYTASAVDPDTTPETVSYTHSGADASLFSLDTTSGVLTFTSAPDYEAPGDSGGDNIYDVTITASDGTNSSTQAVAVTVTPVDEAALTAASATVVVIPGAAATGQSVGSISTSDSDDDDAYTYALTGTHASNFEVDEDGNVLYMNTDNIPAAGQNLDLTIMVSDSMGTVTATTTALVGGITIGGAYVLAARDEQNSVGTQIDLGALSAADVFGTAATTYAVTATQTSADGTVTTLTGFSESGGNLVIESGANIDREAGPIVITVTATSAGSDVTVTFALPLDDVDDSTPTISNLAASIGENVAIGTTVYTAVAEDADTPAVNGDFTFTMADTNGFTIDSATGAVTTTELLDFEGAHATPTTLMIMVSDGTNTSTAYDVVVTVGNVNEAPGEITGSLILTPDQAVSTTTKVGSVSATDPEGDTITYEVVGDFANNFMVDASGDIFYTAALNDADNVAGKMLDVQITASDGTLTSEATGITGLVGGILLSPDGMLATGASEITINEGTNIDYSIVVADGVFAENSMVTHTRNGANASTWGNIAGAGLIGNNIATGEWLDAEATAVGDNDYDITDGLIRRLVFEVVSVSDQNTASDASDDVTMTTTFTITAGDVDDNDPTLSVSLGNQGARTDMAFNLDLSDFLTDADSDGDTLTYALVDDTGAAATVPAGLTLDASTGLITGTPTTTGMYTFTATLTDASGDTAMSDEFVITVTGPPPANNYGPTISRAESGIVPEGQDVFIRSVIGDKVDSRVLTNPFTGEEVTEITGITSEGQVLRDSGKGDYFEGRGFNDVLIGGAGNDILDGGINDDTLVGGDHADYFVYRFDSSGAAGPDRGEWRGIDGNDTIFDFSTSQGDKLVFIDESTESDRIDSYEKFIAEFGVGTDTVAGYVAAFQDGGARDPDPANSSLYDNVGFAVSLTFASISTSVDTASKAPENQSYQGSDASGAGQIVILRNNLADGTLQENPVTGRDEGGFSKHFFDESDPNSRTTMTKEAFMNLFTEDFFLFSLADIPGIA